LRIASPKLQLWTHYDVMDNVLFQKIGHKRLLVFHPDDVDALYFHGPTSRVIDLDAALHDERFPLFKRAMKNASEIILRPGEALFIPALWPHNAMAEEFSVAVNIFWKTLPESFYWKKDLYGNRDPRQAEESMKLLQESYNVLRAAQNGESLPEEFIRFYAIKGAAQYRCEHMDND